MLPSKDLQYSIDRQVFKEGFVFHGISRPVIRKVNNEYCIACFVTMFNMQGFADGLFDRPDYWVAADIADGTVKMIYQCREYGEDFCESVFARRYDLRSLSPAPLSPKYYEKAFAMLDDVRKELLESGTFNTGLYNLYMKRILAECPLPYRKFFRSLSNEG